MEKATIKKTIKDVKELKKKISLKKKKQVFIEKKSAEVEKKSVEKEKTEKQKKEIKKLEQKNKYLEAVGKRKTSTAQVRLFINSKEKDIKINSKPYKDYFPIFSLQKKVESAFEKLKYLGKFGVSIKVKGGGISSQADACCHGIARALVLLNPYFKKRLKKAGLLTRDSRIRERKKFGLKRARKAPQWSKR